MPYRHSKIIALFYLIWLFISPSVSAALHPQTTQFLSLADIHFDPFIGCRDVKPCPLIEKLRHAPSSAWPAIFAAVGTPAPLFRQDTNYLLLTSALSASKQAAAAKHAQFVIVLGDFLGHNFKKFYAKYSADQTLHDYQAFVKKTLEFLTNELSRTFPTLDVYTVIGNNDSYQSDYVSHPHSKFFQDTANLWSRLIKNKKNQTSMQQSFPTAGYYAVDIPGQSNLRLIVLNTVLFSYRAKGSGVSNAANEELDWLKRELAAVAAKHQKAFIAMHIPLGIDLYASLHLRLFKLIELWKPEYINRFQAELKQYAPDIAAIFAGHLHSDWFQLLTFNPSIDIPMIGTPAISPIFGNNPGFKIYSYSTEPPKLEDFITYYYPLGSGKTWGMEYNFNQLYQFNCHACQKHDEEAAGRTNHTGGFYTLFHPMNVSADIFTQKWKAYYWCAVNEINPDEEQEC